MKRTENLYKELKEKIKDLVEFMVSNDLNSADISLDISKEFTLCNVKYKNKDNIKDEFLYLYEDSEKLKNSYCKKLDLKENKSANHMVDSEDSSIKENCNKSESSSENIPLDDLSEDNLDNTNSTVGIKEIPLEENSTENNKEHTKNIDSSTDKKPEEPNTKKDIKEAVSVENSVSQAKQAKDNNTKDKSKSPINFKEELIFQREIVLNILKEYNLIS